MAGELKSGPDGGGKESVNFEMEIDGKLRHSEMMSRVKDASLKKMQEIVDSNPQAIIGVFRRLTNRLAAPGQE